jgi:glycosyltransferase involved in cell wall biosynthesis
MTDQPAERCSIIVDVRDRFSTLAPCLRTLGARTPEPHDLIVVVGGASERLRRGWLDEFGQRARFLFGPGFLNQAQARNRGLRVATTRLAVVMDSDVFVRPGWLEALLRCQRETGAVMVVPILLETERRIHTAGNDLYVTYDQGRAFGHKVLRYHWIVLGEGSNLRRQRTDYGELHCQLVEVEPILTLGAYDEKIIEVGEVDFGLTCAAAGREMWFEPESVVHYALKAPVEAEDVRLFEWRWDMRAVKAGYQYFERKWNMDITEHGTFRDFLWNYHKQVGILPRLFPSPLTIALDRRLRRARRVVDRLTLPFRAPALLARRWKARRIHYDDWPRPNAD